VPSGRPCPVSYPVSYTLGQYGSHKCVGYAKLRKLPSCGFKDVILIWFSDKICSSHQLHYCITHLVQQRIKASEQNTFFRTRMAFSQSLLVIDGVECDISRFCGLLRNLICFAVAACHKVQRARLDRWFSNINTLQSSVAMRL